MVSVAMSGSKAPFLGLCALTTISLGALFHLALFYAPIAQAAAGGFAQKIFYFHVPAAYAMYLSGVACMVASAMYLQRATPERDAWAKAGAECATFFGLVVMTSGPFWAKKAWGVYWTWDPRLTTLLLSVLIYASIVLLRTFLGDGGPERRFLSAFGVLGTVNLPIIHLSVRKWGGNHPAVITAGGGGIAPQMRTVLMVGFLAMTLLAALLLWLRVRNAMLEQSVAALEHRVTASIEE
jgi:heme exporter protein C